MTLSFVTQALLQLQYGQFYLIVQELETTEEKRAAPGPTVWTDEGNGRPGDCEEPTAVVSEEAMESDNSDHSDSGNMLPLTSTPNGNNTTQIAKGLFSWYVY